MKTKTTLKRRLLSGLLALVMVLGFFPAGLPLPASAAVVTTGHTLTVKKDGSFTLTFKYPGAAGDLGNYALAVLPDVSARGGTAAPSKQVFNDETGGVLSDTMGTIGAFNSALTNLQAPGGPGHYFYQNSGGTRISWSNGTLTVTGSLGMSFTQALAAENGKYKADGNQVSGSDSSIPVVALLWSSVGPKFCATTSVWQDVNPAVLTATPSVKTTFKGSTNVSIANANSAFNGTAAATIATGNMVITLTNSGGEDAILKPAAITSLNSAFPDSKLGLYTMAGGSEAVVNANITVPAGSSIDVYLKVTATTGQGVPQSVAYANGTVSIPYTTRSDERNERGPVVTNWELDRSTQYYSSEGGIHEVTQGDTTSFTDIPIISRNDAASKGYTIVNFGWISSPDIGNLVSVQLTGTASDGTNQDSGALPGNGQNLVTNWNKSVAGDLKLTVRLHDASAATGVYQGTFRVTYRLNEGVTTGATINTFFPITLIVNPGVVVTTHTVKFDLNEPAGTANPSSYANQTVADGDPAGYPGTPTLPGYAFKGWSTNSGAAATGTYWTSGDSTDAVTADVTYYAIWQKLYTVSFDLNGGSGTTPDPITQTTVGGSITLPASTGITKSGYVFAGWKADSDANATGAGQSYTPTADVIMKAQWKPTYAVTFLPNWPGGVEGTGTVPSGSTYENIEGGNSVTIPGNTGTPALAKPGYTWKGWARNTDGTDPVTVGSSLTINDNVTLYAVWEEIPHITGASLDKTPKANVTVTLKDINLNIGGPLHASDVGSSNKVTTANWYIGSGAVDANGVPMIKSDKLNTTSPASSVQVPSYAVNGDYLWVELAGNGTDVRTDTVWVKFAIGEDKLTLNVGIVVLNAAGNALVTPTPAGISRAGDGSSLSANAAQTISTTSVNQNYKFLGWSTYNTTAAASNILVNGASVAGGTLGSFNPNPHDQIGVNSAVFTAPSTVNSGSSVTLYAVYQALPTNNLNVAVVLDGSVQTNANINVGGSKPNMKAEDTSTITANTTKPGDYVFHGWSTNTNGSPIITDGTNNLTGISTGAAGGSALFKMPTPPAPTTIYAVYTSVSSHNVDIVLNPGVASVEVTTGATKQTMAGTGGSTIDRTVTVSVKEGQTITVVTNPDTGYEADGFSVAGNNASNYEGVLNATTSFICVVKGNGLTITAKAKLKPPVLQLTPTAGMGSVDGGVATNPEVAVSNIGGAGAKITKITIGNSNFSNDSTTNVAVGDTIATTDTGKKIVLNPAAGLAAGTYTIPVTVTYTDPDGGNLKTATTNVTYVVTATNKFNGSVVVKIDGTAADAPSVTLSNASGVTSTPPSGGNGTTTFTGLSINQSHVVTVSIGGVSYPTNFSLSPDNTSVEVNFVTVTAKVSNTANEQAALTSGSIALSVADDSTSVTSTNLASATASKIVLKGSAVSLGAVPNGIATGYIFDKWNDGTSDISTSQNCTIVANDNNKTYTAYLKKSAQVVLTYNGNFDNAPDHAGTDPGIGVPPAQTVDAGGTATVSSMKPVLGGYKFVGWSTTDTKTAANWNANNSDDYAGGNTISMPQNETLYAVWAKAAITANNASVTGTYGSGFSYTYAAKRNDGITGGLTYTVTGGNALPGGLTLNSTTGVISGIPYEVCTNRQVTITVTPTADTNYRSTTTDPFTQTATLTITVNKAQPTVTGISPVGTVVSGADLTSVGWEVTVVGPRYKGTPSANTASTASDWEQYTDTITYAITTGSKTDGLGVAPVTATNNKFAASPTTSTSVTANFTPQAVGTGTGGAGDFDTAGKNNKQNSVWLTATGTKTINHNGNSPEIEVSTDGANFSGNQSWLYAVSGTNDPAHAGYSQNTAGTNGFVTAGTGTGADTVNAKQFNIKNNGTADTGTLSYNLGANSKFTIVGNGPTDLAAGASGTVTIVPNANLPVGTYTDTLTITDNSSTATIHVTFVVTNAKTFTATIHVDKQAMGDTSKATDVQFPAGLGLKLVNGSNETAVAAGHWVAADNAYKVTNLAVGETYRLVGTGLSNAGGGEYDTGLTITSNGASQTVTYYQIAVTKDPSDLTLSPDVSGGGWYMDGQYATLNTAASGSKGGGTYDFKQWEKGSDTYGGPLANVQVSAGNVTYTAKYTLRAAGTSTVTYMDNTNTTGGSTYATFVVTNGQTHTVIAGPNRDGYVFKGWNTTMNGTGGTAYAVGATINAATVQTNPTLYAQWDPAEIGTWNNDTDAGTYGVPYSYTVPFPSTTDGAGVTLAATGLPGGLSFNAATGVISGTPYAMGSHTITVTATHKYWNGSDANHNYPETNAALTKTFTLTLTVEKYTPVLSALTVTNVANGQPFSSATYTGVVTAPLLATKGGTAAGDKWTTTSWTVGYNPALTGANTQGTLAPNTGTFTTSGGSVAMTHTPDATKADANSAVYNTIYNNATGTVEASLTNTYTMQVQTAPVGGTAGSWDTSAAHETWSARVGYKNDGTPANGASDTTNNKVSAQTFGLRNTGNQATGTLAYTWGTTGGDISALFTLAGQPASLTAGGNGTFTIVPQTGLATGTYQDTLTIKNTNGYSVTVKVKIVVNDPSNYTVTINTDHWDVGATSATRKNLTQGGVVLKNASGDVTMAGTAGVYTGSAVYGRTYTVEVNGYTVPNLTISVTTHEATVNLRQVTVADDCGTGTMTTVSQPNKGYVVDGESVTVTYGTPPTNYAFQKLEDTTASQVRSTTGAAGGTYSQPITQATAYKVTWTETAARYTLSFDGNDETAGNPPAAITVDAGTSVILPGQLSLEKNGYVFKGWGEAKNTTVNGTGFHLAGSSFTVNATRTLYAVWEPVAGGLYLRDKVITAYYGEDLSGQNLKVELVGTPVGAVTYAINTTTTGSVDPLDPAKWDGILSVGNTDAAITGTPKLSGVDASTATTGQTYNEGLFTIKVKATDAGTSLDTPDANLTIRVEKAATQVDPAYKPAVKSSVTLLPGNTFDPATQLDPGKVNAIKQDGTTTLQPNVPGTWTLATGEDGKITSGTTTIRLTFKPFDIGFKPVDYELPVTVGEKAINGATIKVAFPASSATAPVKSDLAVTLVTDTVTGTPNAATTDVTISDVKWVGLTNNGKFDTTKDTTLIVVLKPTNGSVWPFVDNDKAFTGHFVNTDDSILPGNPDVHLSHNSGEATLTYTWAAQDRPFEKVDVQVGQLAVGATNNTTVAPKEPTKYGISSYHWYNVGTTTEVTDFAADTLYDLVVTFKPEDGWKFGDVFANKADDADLSAIATVNDGKPAEGSKTNLAEGATDAAPTTVTVRYASFKPVAQTIVGIEWVSGNLATQDYYAITTTDQKAGGSDVKDTTDGVYGHSAHSAIYSNAMTSPLTYKLVYSNGNKSANIVYGSDSGEKLVYGTAPVGTLPDMPANGHVFTNVSAPTDQSTYDGKNVYLAYTTGSNTFYAAAPIGTLTVRELEAQRIVPSRQWTTTELTFVAGVDTFAVPNGITATVNFNTDCALTKTESGFTYNATQTNGNNTHYYKLDTDGNGIPETAIASGDAMTTDMSGKTLYICYTDINNNEVYAPVGVLRTSGDTTLKVWIDNPTPGTTDPKDGHTTTDTTGGSSKPEYGETIKAVIDGTPTGPVEYKWYRGTDDPANPGQIIWNPTPIGTGPTHTLTPDDIDKHIKVEITEGGTSGTVTSVNIPVGQRRTLKLDVTAVNKNYDGTATNGHTYATGDPATAANDFYLYNVINNDKVYVSGYTGTKPNYTDTTTGADSAAVDSEITWPAITDGNRGSYTLGGAHGSYYRLGDQPAIAHRGKILADGVIHVDVSFQKVPVFDDEIPKNPMGVTDLRQTRPASTTDATVDNAVAFAGDTKWYKDGYTPGGTNTPLANVTGTTGGAKFEQGTYTVEVKVKPVAGYNYTEGKTKFYFHFGVDKQVEVAWPTTADGTTTYHGLIPNGDGTYTMYYTFDAVELVKIAHVNVSVPQPVVYGTPANGSVNQALGTDNSIRTTDVTMGNITWYKGATGSDTLSGGDQFQAGGTYRAEFDLITTNNYKYLNKATPEDSIDVDFTVSGVGPIVGVTATPFTDASNPVITSVTTSTTDANTKYHVVVLYKAISGGKVALTDVYVNATIPDVTKTLTYDGVGKEPNVDAVKPYKLTGTDADSVWQFWNKNKAGGAGWDTITAANAATALDGGKFKAGVDYQVIAKVKLEDTTHYEITTNSKFYLAGLACTTTPETVNHGAYTPLVPSANPGADGKYAGTVTFTLTRQFFIPVDKIITAVTTNAVAPAVGGDASATAYTQSGKVTLAVNQTGNVLTDRVTPSAVTWKEQQVGGTFTNFTGTFDKGKVYQAQYTLTTDTANGYTYKDETNSHVKFTIHGIDVGDGAWEKNDPVSGITVRADRVSDTVYTITVTYPETKSDAAIAEVTVNYTAPVEKAHPAVALNYTSTEQVTLDRTALKSSDSDNGSTWHTDTKTGTVVTETDAFGTGDYVVASTFSAKDGFVFSNATRFIVNGHEYTKAANAADVMISADNKTATVWHTFPGQDKVIVRVAANATQPVAGETIPTTPATLLLAQNKDGHDMTGHVTVGNMSWTLADGTAIPTGDNNKFVVGRQYKVTFDVTAKDAPTYPFLDDTVKPDYVDFLINNVQDGGKWIDGETATPVTDKDITVTTAKKNGSSDVYTVTVTFPMTGTIADVLTVWGIAMPEPAVTEPDEPNMKVADSPLTVPPSEPYEVVSAGTKWQHKETDGTWRDTTANEEFLPGHTYKAVIQTQLKTTGPTAGKYQFMSTTGGYINGVTATPTPTTGAGTSEHPQYITLEREFPVPKKQIIVHLGADVPPEAGVYALSPDTDIIGIHAAHQAIDNNYYTLLMSETAWYKEDMTTRMTATDTFQEGEVYYLITTAEAKEGYCFSNQFAGYQWVDNYNQNATKFVDPAHPSGEVTKARVAFRFALGGSAPEPKTPIVQIDPPVKGNTPDRSGESPNNSVKIIGTADWTGTLDGGRFKAGESYTTKIYIDRTSPDGLTTFIPNRSTVNLDGQNVTVQQEPDGRLYITRTWTLPGDPPPQTIPGGGGTTVIEDYNVNYWLSTAGTSDDAIGEHVAKNKSPKNVPTVTALNGYTFLGWSLDNPAKVADPKLVDPKTVKITEDTTFYAIYKKDYDHSHYVIGFPDGTFGPDNNITRGQVATIIARACLDGFQEGANYGNPGGYSDVSEHWAYSAISYCSMHDVFTGYEDGTFRPDAAISRQELATAVARLGEMQTSTGVPFTDSADVAAWAQDAVYTAYANGWIKGYEDGTFLPENDIKRSETVTIFNGYLERTVNKEGLSELSEYVHSGVASNLQGGNKAYMTWPDVPESHWAYYEIIEAANDHDYHKADEADPKSTEMWETAKIDEIWRYHDDLDDGADRVDDLMNGTRLTAAEAKAQAEAEAKAKAEAEAKAKAEAEAAAKAAEEAAKAEAEAKAAEEAAKAEEEAKAAEEAAKAAEEAAKAEEEAAKAETNPSETMIHRAYINGFEDGTFRPDASITRAAVASVIAQTLLEGYDPDVTYDTDLVDLDEHWAKNYVAFCVQNGVFGGYEDNTFRPDQGISRQEFAVVLAKLSGLTGEGELTFSDSADVADWAASGVNAAVSKGWLKGYEDGTFLPEKLITRAEAVKIFNSYLGRGVNYNGLSGVPGGSIWSDVSPTHWAYLEIVEAANDHTYHWSDADDPTPPERWETAGEI